MTSGGKKQTTAPPSIQKLKKIRNAIRSGEEWYNWPDVEVIDFGNLRESQIYCYADQWIIKEAQRPGRVLVNGEKEVHRLAREYGYILPDITSVKPPKKELRRFGLEAVKPCVFVKDPLDDILWMIQPKVQIVGYENDYDDLISYEKNTILDLHNNNIGYDWKGRLCAIDW